MRMELFFLLVWVLLITPVEITAAGQWRGDASATVTVRVWGFPITLRTRTQRTPAGHRLIILPRRRGERPHDAPPERVRGGLILLGALLRSNHGRALLWRGVRRVDLAVRLSLSDASHTALASGALSGAFRTLPKAVQRRIRLRVVPDFFAQGGQVGGKCILFFHLGTLLAAAALLLSATLLEAREHAAPKEA